jgi:hypothetical protein
MTVKSQSKFILLERALCMQLAIMRRLSSMEIGSLWTCYIQDSVLLPVLYHFLENVQDKEILRVIENTFVTTEKHHEEIIDIFRG